MKKEKGLIALVLATSLALGAVFFIKDEYFPQITHNAEAYSRFPNTSELIFAKPDSRGNFKVSGSYAISLRKGAIFKGYLPPTEEMQSRFDSIISGR